MSLRDLAQQFVTYFEKADFNQCAQLMPGIKIEMAKAGVLVPKVGAPENDLVAVRHVLELAVLAAIHNRDDAEVGRLFSLVRPFYSAKLKLPASPNENKITGLYLLLLVAKNEIAQFHTELDVLENTGYGDATDPYLAYPLHLEQWLMEGLYDKVWKAITQKSQFPSAEFAVIAESLITTVRLEIAACTEKAYSSLPIGNARHLLFLSSDQEIIDFVNNEQPTWKLKDGNIYFPKEEEEFALDAPSGPENLISNTIDYAVQIETII